MPFARPSLTDLREQAAQDMASELPGSDPLLRFSNLYILSQLVAGMSHLHYGYLDWIAQQAVPFTATDEFLEGWAALVNVFREPATQASGTVTFPGINGTLLPSGTPLVRGDNKTFHTTANGTVAGGFVTVPVIADADATGATGAWGNCPAGTLFTISQAVAGVTSTGTAATTFTGGADVELDDSLRARMLFGFQHQPQGGDANDYIAWALTVNGVTRVWVCPNLAGPGTVSVFFMMDQTEVAHGGFPQGTNGVSANDKGPGGVPRDVVATGDQLAVANALCAVAPVTALVYAVAPTQQTVPITIDGISAATTTTRNAIAAAITNVFLQYATITGAGTTVPLSYIESAIAAVPGTTGFVITSPAGNVVVAAGALPVLGTVTYT